MNVELKKKQKANQIVAMAKVNGIISPHPCIICGDDYKPNAHHENYDKPLEIIWLCASCHKKVHNKSIQLTDKIII